MADAWYKALSIIADHCPAAYWRMPNGAEFWWMPGHSQLGPDRFTEQPFGYDEIESVTVFDLVRMGTEVLACGWRSLREQLLGIRSLRVEELQDVRCPPAAPPNQALRLTVAP